MTTQLAAREAVYQAWKTGWGSTTPFALDNEKTALDEGRSPWARVAVRHADGGQDTLGVAPFRRYRRVGLVFVQIFVPTDSGLERADELAEAARGIFEGKSIGELDFDNAQVREVGADGKWFQIVVEAVFSYDEQK